MLKGYRTYILSGAGVCLAAVNYLVGDITLTEALQTALLAASGATLRAGISTTRK